MEGFYHHAEMEPVLILVRADEYEGFAFGCSLLEAFGERARAEGISAEVVCIHLRPGGLVVPEEVA